MTEIICRNCNIHYDTAAHQICPACNRIPCLFCRDLPGGWIKGWIEKKWDDDEKCHVDGRRMLDLSRSQRLPAPRRGEDGWQAVEVKCRECYPVNNGRSEDETNKSDQV